MIIYLLKETGPIFIHGLHWYIFEYLLIKQERHFKSQDAYICIEIFQFKDIDGDFENNLQNIEPDPSLSEIPNHESS